MMTGSGGMGGEYMTMNRNMWDRILSVLGSGRPEAAEQAYAFLLGAAPRVWEPSSRPVFDGGSGDGDAPGNVPGPPASPSPQHGTGRCTR